MFQTYPPTSIDYPANQNIVWDISVEEALSLVRNELAMLKTYKTSQLTFVQRRWLRNRLRQYKQFEKDLLRFLD